MDSVEKAKEFLRRFHASRPKAFMDKLDENDRGMFTVMHFLFFSDRATAGDISAELGMSTPRVAAALNALQRKGFVSRTASDEDRRVRIVELTEAGRAEIQKCDEAVERAVAYLYDVIGERDLEEYLRISEAIAEALSRHFGGNGR